MSHTRDGRLRLFQTRAIAGITIALLFVVAANAGRRDDTPRPLGEQIDGILAAPALSRGYYGYKFVDLESGLTLAERNANSLFVPASNAKLFTTALALVRLGADYRFTTTVKTSRWTKTPGGVADLVLVGGGDPNLSGRVLPYAVDTPDHDPLTAISQLADQIVHSGVTHVDGDIIGDDTRYLYEPYPDGWTIDDSLWYYGAPVGALSVNDSAVHVSVRPTSPGDLAEVAVSPDVGEVFILNQVLTVEGGGSKVSFRRTPGSQELVISGTIGRTSPSVEEDVAVVDPALFAARALRFALEERGVRISGEARARHRYHTMPGADPVLHDEEAITLATISSAPLWEAIQVVNKVSQNQHAEMLLREVSFAAQGMGSLDGGLRERQTFLSQVQGIPPSDELVDASGLARQDLTSPNALVALLNFMWHRPERDLWLQSLPVGGVDGTLEKRLVHVSGSERLHAKTGSLSHIASLSGYLLTRNGRWLVFSLVVNNEGADSWIVRNAFDSVCALFLNQ